MDIRQSVEKLEENSEFIEWRKKNKDYYLAHVFSMLDEANKGSYQVGYSNPDCTKITTFIVTENDVQIAPDSEVFKKPGSKIEKLELEDIKIGGGEALKKAEECRKEHYSQDSPVKMFFIVQKLDIGQVYNITFVTATLKAINIKISTSDGKIVHHEETSLMDMRMK
jgi:hypothetical protein